MKKIYLASPHMSEEKYEEKYIKEAFDTNWLSTVGENLNKFEESVREYLGVKASVAVASGTAGIHLGLKVLGVEKDDIVFVSDLTFSASVNPIIYQNATPVFIDSEYQTWNMSPKALEKAFEKYKPKAVIVVHLYGRATRMEKILEICKETGIKTRALPTTEDVINKQGAINSLRDVEIEDLLGREAVHLDNKNIQNLIKGKTVLVTGGRRFYWFRTL